MNFENNKKLYRTIWISDTHLGTSGSKSSMLLEFLDQTDSEYLFLVGDIIDGWRMRKKMYWHQEHNDVVQKVLKKAKNMKIGAIPIQNARFCSSERPRNLSKIFDFLRSYATSIKLASEARFLQILVPIWGSEF